MIIKVDKAIGIPASYPLSVRCPGCGHLGTFHVTGGGDLSVNQRLQLGFRICPNQTCRMLIYFILQDRQLILTFPFLRIDFDKTNIPDRIIKALEEAITCHANKCYIASAIMIRKSLDLLCIEQGAAGSDLKSRITSLGSKVLIPKELLEGMDDLRLLGNDAAHVESQVFDDVGEEEVETGIEFTKEILKAVYQYSSLLAKLKSLKKNP